MQPLYEALLFAAIMASRNEQSALLTFSSTVVVTVTVAAETDIAGSAINVKATITMEVKTLLNSEEKVVVRII